MWLIDLDDAQLESGLGLTVEDIAVLRTGTKTASPLRKENDSARARWDRRTDRSVRGVRVHPL
jgi:hypothetical protein